jgi:hypothetical protein
MFVETIIDNLFEVLYICVWFMFLGTIFYEIFIIPLKRKLAVLYYVVHNTNKNNNSFNQTITNKLIDIQDRIQLISDKLEKNEDNTEEINHIGNLNELPPQTHITFPHFLIISTSVCRDPTICLLSGALSSLLGVDLGTCLAFEAAKKRFIIYIENNKLVKNDILILNSTLMNLFNITHNNYTLKLSDCETFIKPHLKNIHR